MIQIDKQDFIYTYLTKLGAEDVDSEYIKFASEGLTNKKEFNSYLLSKLGLEFLSDFDDSVLEETVDYYSDLKKFKKIPKSKLNKLLKEYYETKNQDVKTEIIHSKLQDVLLIACAYKIKHIDINLNDLVQTCNIGLIMAVDKYIPDNKITFDDYLHYWIFYMINKEFTLGEQKNG